jgi:hypothetical protein
MRMSWKWWNAVLWLVFADLTLASIGQATKWARFSLDTAAVMLAIATLIAFIRWTLAVYLISRIVAWVQRRRAAPTAAAPSTIPPSA